MGGFTANPGSSAAASPLPPLPNLPAAPAAGGQGSASAPAPGSPDFLASILSGIAPVKMAVDQIHSACQQIVRNGINPEAEQICGQIVALASSLLPIAAQQALQPGMGGAGGGMNMLPPPGPPAPVGGVPPGGGVIPGMTGQAG